MAMASREDNTLKRYGTLSCLREEITWKLAVRVRSADDRNRKRKRPGAARRDVNCTEQYYDSLGEYIQRGCGAPTVLDDNLMELEETTDTPMVGKTSNSSKLATALFKNNEAGSESVGSRGGRI